MTEPFKGLRRRLAILVVLMLAGVGTAAAHGPPDASSNANRDRWLDLLETTPFPHAAPLPPPERTPIDGAYTKVEPQEGERVPCRRCPDYAPEGGLWRLNLDRGIFRIFHAVSGWRSIGSFTLEADIIFLFNDPNCPKVTGRYTWSVKDGKLTLRALGDTCAIGLRARNLTSLPWVSCGPPAARAVPAEPLPKPSGCD